MIRFPCPREMYPIGQRLGGVSLLVGGDASNWPAGVAEISGNS